MVFNLFVFDRVVGVGVDVDFVNDDVFVDVISCDDLE